MTTEQLINEWMTCEKQERIKAQAYIRYMGLIKLHIIPALGEYEITQITRQHIRDFIS